MWGHEVGVLRALCGEGTGSGVWPQEENEARRLHCGVSSSGDNRSARGGTAGVCPQPGRDWASTRVPHCSILYCLSGYEELVGIP